MKSEKYYSDINSERMIDKRKRGLKLGYLFTAMILFGFSLPFIGYIKSAWSEYPIETNIGVISLWIIVVFFGWWGFYYAFIMDEKNALNYGIVLDDKALQIYGKEIALPTILRAEVAGFAGSGIFLAIGYLTKKNGKMKIKTHLLEEEKTDNIYQLCNEIRKLKNWPEQTKSSFYRWRDWKKSLTSLEE